MNCEKPLFFEVVSLFLNLRQRNLKSGILVHLYFVDSRGRVGMLRNPDTGLCQYAYGDGAYPRNAELVTPLNEEEAKHRLAKQQEQMWVDVVHLQPLARRLAKRYPDPETLYLDVGLPMLCYIAVTHVPGKSAIEYYAAHALGIAYSKASRKSLVEGLRVENCDLNDMQENCQLTALIAKDELYTLGLATPEMDLLLSRFDSEQSLEDIANELGLSSRGSSKARIDKIIQRCRSERLKSEE